MAACGACGHSMTVHNEDGCKKCNCTKTGGAE